MDESHREKREQQGAPEHAPGIRASDADRDRVADILGDALAEGRITAEEHAERIDVLYATKTVGELEPLTRDLPVPAPVAAPAPRPAAPAVPPAAGPAAVAVFGGAVRKGRWRPGARVRAVAVFGGVEIDLTEAVFESPDVVVQVAAVFGGVSIVVPENVTVRGEGGVGVFGGFDVKEHESDERGAPVVRVRGAAVFGGVDVKRKTGKRLKQWGT